MILSILVIILSYLIGSISSAILVCRLLRLPDPREHGSHNPGATNVLRLGGKKAAAIALLGDSLKGLLPVLGAKALMLGPQVIGLVAVAAFLGHLYPVFFRFQGGKGVATAIGTWLGLAWLLGGLAVLTWVIVAKVSRYSSMAAIITAILVVLYSFWWPGPVYFGPILLISVLLLWRHRPNIQRLIQGQEPKLGEKVKTKG